MTLRSLVRGILLHTNELISYTEYPVDLLSPGGVTYVDGYRMQSMIDWDV